jgi:hypothetical protein
MSTLGTIAGRIRSAQIFRLPRLFVATAPQRSAMPPCSPAHPSALLTQALEEDSNRELDWLWYAEQLTDAVEQAYCRARARWITP